MKLNVGSAVVPLNTGWINLDATAWPVHVQADARLLPFRSNSFEAVHSSHVIEHIPMIDVPNFLSELRRVMRRDAVLYISAPDGTRTKAINSSYWSYMARR